MDAFDTDVLIYAAERTDERGQRVAALLASWPEESAAGVGSVLLIPELLSKPLRLSNDQDYVRLDHLLNRLDLREVSERTAVLAADLAATYRLKSIDAVHLATAFAAGADRFITDNQRDFPKTIEGIEITYPDDLPEPP
jgi:predicted nucleic acid-binding protein